MSDAMDLVVIDDDDNSNAITTFVNVLHKQHPGSLTLIENALVFQKSADLSAPITILWNTMVKHQVSPVTYPKPLLKIIINTTGSSSNLTFQMANRNDLERIRQEITVQLQRTRSKTSSNVGTISTSNHPTTNSNPRKRSLATLQSSDGSHLNLSSFEALDSTILAVTRSSLLAANPALRQQHAHLVLGVEESSAANNKSNTNTTSTSTLTEDDFWQTHQSLLEEEYARISGLSKAGTSSFFASHLPGSGKVVLGVEEMRQIFILYPAVHKVCATTTIYQSDLIPHILT
jgi:transcription initiation factor TFIIH subunit 1